MMPIAALRQSFREISTPINYHRQADQAGADRSVAPHPNCLTTGIARNSSAGKPSVRRSWA